MKPINLKILPLALAALVTAYLSFRNAATLISNPEILLNLNSILVLLISFIIFAGLTSFLISLNLSLTQSKFARAILFFLIFLPFGSVFIFQGIMDLIYLGILLVIFIAMSLMIIIEFDRLYANQIKAHIYNPARSNARTLTFFIALSTALVFFGINQTPADREMLTKDLMDDIKETTTEAVQNYGGIDTLIQQQTGGTISTSAVKPQLNEYIETQVDSILSKYEPYIFYILIALIFMALIGTSTFVSILSALSAVAFISLLKSSGYIQETKEQVEVTRFTL